MKLSNKLKDQQQNECHMWNKMYSTYALMWPLNYKTVRLTLTINYGKSKECEVCFLKKSGMQHHAQCNYKATTKNNRPVKYVLPPLYQVFSWSFEAQAGWTHPTGKESETIMAYQGQILFSAFLTQ